MGCRFAAAVSVALLIVAPSCADESAGGAPSRPDVLFIAVDDLNDWITPLAGHPQTLTPHFQRLADRCVLFTNAHCVAPSCGPSRSAIMTGVPPWRSGLYHNMQPLREKMPEATLMPRHFANNGYEAVGAGKILHFIIDPPSWDDYFPDKAKDDPLPFTLYPEERPVSLPRGGRWQYFETDWGPLDTDDEGFGGDYSVTSWVADRLAHPPDQAQFLACGIYRPHEPWFVPEKYFEPFPLESIQLPPGYDPADLDDVPEAGRRLARNRYFPHIQWHGQWRSAVRAYLASIHFADAMLGRVLDALDKSPRRDNTIVVLWSDHGWHLGEKEHWQKYTGWRACTRVPLMIHVPEGAPGLPGGTKPSRCDRPVSTFDLYRTLSNVAGVPAGPSVAGNDLTPLLEDPDAEWPHHAVTQLGRPHQYSVSGQKYRFIHYRDGGQELYDIEADPYEHKNLADDPEHAATLSRLKQSAPKDPAEFTRIRKRGASLGETERVTLVLEGDPPASRGGGRATAIQIANRRAIAIKLFWVDQAGDRQPFGEIAAASEREIRTFAAHTWLLETADGGPLGHFVTPPKGAKVTVE